MNHTSNASKTPRLLVHLHLYYQDQWPYFKQKLANIRRCKWDLFVTVSKANATLARQILDFKKDAHILNVSNVGYDIWPFLQVLYKVNLSDYDYVLKLHSKQLVFLSNISPTPDKDMRWRDCLVNALLATPDTFLTNLKLMEQQGGLCAAASCCLLRTDILPEDTFLYAKLHHELKLSFSSRWFVAGTMFLIRAACLEKLQQHPFEEQAFISVNKSGSIATLAHALERIFIPLVLEQHLKIYLIHPSKLPLSSYMHYLRYGLLSHITWGNRKIHYVHKRIYLQSALFRTHQKKMPFYFKD